jgi:hypothetical protein
VHADARGLAKIIGRFAVPGVTRIELPGSYTRCCVRDEHLATIARQCGETLTDFESLRNTAASEEALRDLEIQCAAAKVALATDEAHHEDARAAHARASELLATADALAEQARAARRAFLVRSAAAKAERAKARAAAESAVQLFGAVANAANARAQDIARWAAPSLPARRERVARVEEIEAGRRLAEAALAAATANVADDDDDVPSTEDETSSLGRRPTPEQSSTAPLTPPSPGEVQQQGKRARAFESK